MAANNVGIVYSQNQQVIRRIIDTRYIGYNANGARIPNPNANDALLTPHQNSIKPGEAWATIPVSAYDQISTHQGLHNYLGLTGIPGVTDRCIVYNNGVVVAVICGDPLITPNNPLGTIALDTTGQATVGLQVLN